MRAPEATAPGRVANGLDPLGVIREEHVRIDLPCERDKFHAGAQFALDFCDMGSSRFSPMLDTIKKIHISAAEKLADKLRDNGADVTFHVWPGAHEGPYWDRHFADYLDFYADACD